VYVLSGEPLEPLLEILHPDHPRAGENEELEKLIDRKSEELRGAASHLAIMVRGGEVKKGRPAEQDAVEQGAARYVTKQRRKGATDEQIAHELSPRGYSVADVERLGEFGLEPDRPD
jgi:hypothetical protein